MSMLVDLLREEQQRALAMQAAIQQELHGLPKGYVSRKIIHGRPAHYLQWREGRRVLSRHIPQEQVKRLSDQVSRRRELQSLAKEVEGNLKRIERALRE